MALIYHTKQRSTTGLEARLNGRLRAMDRRSRRNEPIEIDQRPHKFAIENRAILRELVLKA
jgi:hypothetical protein